MSPARQYTVQFTMIHERNLPMQETDKYQMPSIIAEKSFPIEGTLRLIQHLSQELDAEKICYCHWKSNQALHRSARGENDLDLLVSQGDCGRFVEILHKLGFKQAVNPPKEQIEGIRDYYGYDATSGKLVHVHMHDILVLGHDATKNYHLPLEEPYLASSSLNGIFRTPSPEFEYIIFILRMVLKHSIWEAILIGHGSCSHSERRELNYLRTLVSENGVQEILRRWLPEVSPDFLLIVCGRLTRKSHSITGSGSAGNCSIC